MKVQLSLQDNSISDQEISSEIKEKLRPFAGLPITELEKKYPGLWFYPPACGRIQKAIQKQTVFEFSGTRLQTGNLLGWIGLPDIHVFIGSRFDQSEKQYFLHYLLKKIFGINLIALAASLNHDELWKLYAFLFPFFLQQALEQGILKKYRRYNSNDLHLKGQIDISRHLKQNMPFKGTVAYSHRELSPDNSVTQLIRHTIEFIAQNNSTAYILKSGIFIRNAVKVIRDITPDYQSSTRRLIISQNLRMSQHPFYSKYTDLQKLCIQILRHEKCTWGDSGLPLCGVLFDGAWLWEQYLAKILSPLSIVHTDNLAGYGRHYLYKGNSGVIYPDFFRDQWIFDAKYKRLQERGKIDRDDRFQLISYLHVMQAQHGYVIYPTDEAQNLFPVREGYLNGLGGELGMMPFAIPQGYDDFTSYSDAMQKSEQAFCANIEQMINQEMFTDNCKGVV